VTRRAIASNRAKIGRLSRTLESGAGPTIYAPAIGFVDGVISYYR
jgi:hypothetical protein